jgi:hypothetical protein
LFRPADQRGTDNGAGKGEEGEDEVKNGRPVKTPGICNWTRAAQRALGRGLSRHGPREQRNAITRRRIVKGENGEGGDEGERNERSTWVRRRRRI